VVHPMPQSMAEQAPTALSQNNRVQARLLEQLRGEVRLLLDDDAFEIQNTIQQILDHRHQQLQAAFDVKMTMVLGEIEEADEAVAACTPRAVAGVDAEPKQDETQPAEKGTHSNLSSNLIEKGLPGEGVDQVEVSMHSGQPFASGLRSVALYFSSDIRRTYVQFSKKRLPVAFRAIVTSIVHSRRFSTLISAAIILNAVFTGITTNWLLKNALDQWTQRSPLELGTAKISLPVWMSVAEYIFSCIFLVELLLRMLAEEMLFLLGSNAHWNIFDVVLVSTAWSDIILGIIGSNSGNNYNFMRVLRVLRVMRSFRIVRLMHSFKELRVVLLSLFASVIPLFWALVCVFILIFLFVIVIMQSVTQHVTEQPGAAIHIQNGVVPHFCSFMVVFKTLLMAITGGQDWHVYFDVTERISSILSVFFIVYVCLMTFGTLNVVTAIMVESAMSKARHDYEVCKAEEHYKMKALNRQLVRLFTELDPDMSGTITKKQWTEICTNPQVIAHFHMLDIDISKGEEVWRLLDLDHSNELDIQEFVNACFQIRGGASYVDIDALMQATRTLMHKTTQNVSCMQAELSQETRALHPLLLQIMNKIDERRNCVCADEPHKVIV